MSDQERISQIRRIKQQIEAALLEIPGVTGVDIGYKVVGGKETGDLAIRVYVAEKKAPEAIPANERVPETFEDVPTDVIERRYVLHGGLATQVEPEESIDSTEGKGANP